MVVVMVVYPIIGEREGSISTAASEGGGGRSPAAAAPIVVGAPDHHPALDREEGN